jgi:hypothetical protein
MPREVAFEFLDRMGRMDRRNRMAFPRCGAVVDAKKTPKTMKMASSANKFASNASFIGVPSGYHPNDPHRYNFDLIR